MPKQYTKESLREDFRKLNHCGSLAEIENYWLDKFSSLKQELLLEVGEDEAEYEHEDFIINEERARVRAIINKKL